MAYEFIPSKWYTKGPRSRGAIKWIVIHTTEGGGYPDHPASARDVATFCTHRPDKVSSHFFVDDLETIQGVRLEDIAYAAPGANAQGIQIEMCGFAAWSLDQWDRHSGLLERVAQLVADMHSRYGMPLLFVDSIGLLASRPGVTEHVEVSKAWHGSDHTDPGPSFPIGLMLGRATSIGGGPPAVVVPVLPSPVSPVSLEDLDMLAIDYDATPDDRGRYPTFEVVTNDAGKEWWLYAWNGAHLTKPEVHGEIQDGTHYEAKAIALPPGGRPSGVGLVAASGPAPRRVVVGGPVGTTYAFDRP